MDDSGNFKEYGDFGESSDSSEPRYSGESSDIGDSGSKKSDDSDTFVNCVILVISRNVVILAKLLILVNHIILVIWEYW